MANTQKNANNTTKEYTATWFRFEHGHESDMMVSKSRAFSTYDKAKQFIMNRMRVISALYWAGGMITDKNENIVFNITSSGDVEEAHTTEDMMMLCDSDGNEIYLTADTKDMCNYIQNNYKNIPLTAYITFGTFNHETRYFEKGDYTDYNDFVAMYSENFTVSAHEIFGTDTDIVNSYNNDYDSATDEMPRPYTTTMMREATIDDIIHKELKTAIAKEQHTTKANYDGIEYPEKEDCKDCISRHDCKYKLTLQFNEKCELKQPVELYVDRKVSEVMTKREVLNAMIEKMNEYDKELNAKLKDDEFKTALEIRTLHKYYIDAALQIAIDNGYNDGAKWQIWEQVCKQRERILNIHD